MNKAKNLSRWNSSWVFNFVMEVLILVVIFIIPTIFDRRLGIVFSGTKTTWMRVLGCLLFGTWAIKLIVTRQHRFIRTALDWPVVSFLLCTTIATLSSVHVYTSFVGFYGRYEGLTSWYLFGLFFFVVTNYIRSFDQLKRIVITVVSASSLMAIYSMVQRHGVDPYMWGGVVTWQRVIGTIGQPNFLAAYMLMAFFMILALLLFDKREDSTEMAWYDQLLPAGYYVLGQAVFLLMIFNLEAYNIILWYGGFALATTLALLFTFTYQRLHPKVLNMVLGFSLLLIYICILYTQSRGGYMGLFTGLVLFPVLTGRKLIFADWKKITALGFLIILVTGITMTRPEFSPFARFSSEITTQQVEQEETKEGVKDVEKEAESKLELKGAAGSRGETWKSGFMIAADYPFFGIGPEVLKMIFPRYETDLFRFKETFHVKQDRNHNETFDVSVTKGLIAFGIYLWLLFTLFKVGWLKSLRAKDNEKLLIAGLLSASLAFLIQNQFSFGVVAITSLFWIVWAMVMVVGDEGKEQEKVTQSNWAEIPWFYVAGVVLLVAFSIYVSFFSFRGDIAFKSGKTQLQMRRFSQAAADFERSLQVFPFEGGAVSHLGIAYLNLSNLQPKRRLEHLNKAIKTLLYGTQVDPYNADNFYMLAKIHLSLYSMGDRAALKQSKDYADIAIEIDPYYAEVYHTRGLIWQRMGRPDQATADMTRAFMINPGLTAPMNDLENHLRRQGKLSQIGEIYKKALIRYSGNYNFLERLARLHLERGRLKEALSLTKKMIRNSPRASAGYILRATAYLRSGETKRAFSDLQTVLVNEPKNIMARNELGRLYLAQGNKARAREEFNQVLRLDKNNVFAKQMLERIK